MDRDYDEVEGNNNQPSNQQEVKNLPPTPNFTSSKT